MSELLVESLLDRAADAVAAQFEVCLGAWRNPAVREPVRAALDAFEAMAVGARRALGIAAPEAHADGFALHRLALAPPRDEEVAAIRAALRALFIAAAMPADESAAGDGR